MHERASGYRLFVVHPTISRGCKQLIIKLHIPVQLMHVPEQKELWCNKMKKKRKRKTPKTLLSKRRTGSI